MGCPKDRLTQQRSPHQSSNACSLHHWNSIIPFRLVLCDGSEAVQVGGEPSVLPLPFQSSRFLACRSRIHAPARYRNLRSRRWMTLADLGKDSPDESRESSTLWKTRFFCLSRHRRAVRLEGHSTDKSYSAHRHEAWQTLHSGTAPKSGVAVITAEAQAQAQQNML